MSLNLQLKVYSHSSLGDPDMNCSTSSTKYGGVQKIQTMTVSELNAYVLHCSPHVHSVPGPFC